MVKRLSESGDMGNFGKGKFIPRPRRKRTQSGVGSDADIKRFFETDFMKQVCKYADLSYRRSNEYFSVDGIETGVLQGVDFIQVIFSVIGNLDPSDILHNVIIDTVLKKVYKDRIKIDAYTELIPDYWYMRNFDGELVLVFDVKRMDSLDSDSEKLPYQRFESYRRKRVDERLLRKETLIDIITDWAFGLGAASVKSWIREYFDENIRYTNDSDEELFRFLKSKSKEELKGFCDYVGINTEDERGYYESYRRTRRRNIRERIEATPEMIQDFSDIYSLINKRLSNRGYKVKREGVADNTWLAIRVFRGADSVYDDFFIDMENLENIVNQLLFRTGYAQDYEVSVSNVDGKSYNVEIIPKEMRASARAW